MYSFPTKTFPNPAHTKLKLRNLSILNKDAIHYITYRYQTTTKRHSCIPGHFHFLTDIHLQNGCKPIRLSSTTISPPVILFTLPAWIPLNFPQLAAQSHGPLDGHHAIKGDTGMTSENFLCWAHVGPGPLDLGPSPHKPLLYNQGMCAAHGLTSWVPPKGCQFKSEP